MCTDNFEQFEIVCVDDASQDGTVELLREYAEKNRIKVMINVVHMSFFQGLESAMNAGRDIAIGDFVYEFDDIFVDYDPEVIMQVYETPFPGKRYSGGKQQRKTASHIQSILFPL